ncbi:hypothetical protein TVAG_298180 [Trichomonas vaginalis G3]|uniref:Potential DNA-binding domain-containing protein n=1 Tax=Trichomonas vaginalis (strain ATCC PRA-98 / G3) TaxID=412133 RepID=A2ET11_TRIV3|nr:hypothetical protein TVAGG3_1033860 [Trichomonas vaginalis G3]EAY04200.1 hypothetical protein TVAG_298180 [Trichomonas vaginalis G3]KAI5493074.1 hypothetical protein TVAGG3_1033860 [Trichomonas vaginalis G3]|eukprot:XP_001316423.1 hypothetical protein [Trichomonas vaginalis G3]
MDQSSIFQQALEECNIDVLTGVYVPTPALTLRIPKSKIISVEPTERFPLDEPDIKEPVFDDLKEAFLSASLEKIVMSRMKAKNSKNSGPLLYSEKISPLPNAEEFVLYKRQKATQLAKECKDDDLPEPIQLCTFPTCLNTAIPTYKFCINHLPLDPNFNDQPFFVKCPQCERIAQVGDEKCVFHKK